MSADTTIGKNDLTPIAQKILLPGEFLNTPEQEFSRDMMGLARAYAPYLGLDLDRDIVPNLSDSDWWEADYGVSVVDGKEIGMSMKDAFRCLVDVPRTYQLAQGIAQEVTHLRSRKRTVIGIDAGTGTGILAMLMVASGIDKVYAIEINDQTHDATQDFLTRLGLSERIVLLKGDATQIVIDQLGEDRADILVSENLSSGLMDEPQYAIINHLSSYLSPDAAIVPFQGQLSVSLSSADWEGVTPGKQEIAERRLRRSERVADPVQYAVVESRPGMNVPIIRNRVAVPTDYKGLINTLLIHTRFQVNKSGTQFHLEPDSADFLGKTNAFKLETGVYAEDGHVVVDIEYEAGRRAGELVMSGEGNVIILSDPYLAQASGS
ncbi:MAG: hypothetical protein ACD_37C00206G0006 [uncultured bacterium]|nr:MAG: hypothetical protein ACD_37C00206G0006 [uncultured bacterium]